MRRTLISACAIVLPLGVQVPGASAADRTFSQRFAVNGHVDAALVGNTLETCVDSPACATAQAGGNSSNNDFTMRYVDVDSDAATFNSSTAELTVPVGALVRFALLSWSGAHDFLDPGAPAAGDMAIDKARSNEALFDTPAPSGAVTVTAANHDIAEGLPLFESYTAVADVTGAVAEGGSGTYRVGNVQAAKGSSSYAGWALLVVYEAAAEPLRNVTVFDGLETVNIGGGSADDVFDIPVSGFATPPAGPVQSKLAVVAYDGDGGIMAGEQFRLFNGSAFQTVSDAASPAGNQFNSSIASAGSAITAKSPNYVNQLGGVDADVFDTSAILTNGQTSTQIRIGSTAETIYANVVAFATVLYAPELALAKSVTDINGGDLLSGDTIEYALTLTNAGEDTANAPTVSDPVPAGTTYVPGSMAVDGAARSDGADGDGAEFSAGVVRAQTPGLAKGASATVRFRVTVTAAPGAVVSNQGSAEATAAAGGFSVTARSNLVARTVVAGPPVAAPPGTPPAKTAAQPSFASVVKLPSTRSCVSRRRFRIRLISPAGDRLVAAVVKLNGKTVKTVKGARLRAAIDLRGLPKGRFTVRITATTASGRKISGNRRYRTCASKR